MTEVASKPVFRVSDQVILKYSAQLQRLANMLKFCMKQVKYDTVKGAYNKCVDQSARMRRLVCVFVVRMEQVRFSRDSANLLD